MRGNRWLRRTGVLLLVVAAVMMVATSAVTAIAQTGSAGTQPAISAEQLDALWNELAAGPVFQQKCQSDFCHATLLTADQRRDKVSEIIFSHGIHRGQFDCSACHTRFPHRFGQVEKPTMKQCFSCHGLRHGPVGIVATDKCEDCHRTPRAKLRPAFHTPDWAKKPHVAPANKELQTRCMMCHDGQFCDDCHAKESVHWEPPVPYVYNPGTGCNQCHAQASMVRSGPGGVVNFQVGGLEGSAHRDLSCTQCHVDFKYENGPDATALWSVNAGLACKNCHDHADQSKVYENSIHWQKVAAGEYASATCASCHGGHNIQRLDTKEASAALHASAYSMCARCHADQYNSYNDYYHGAAYKRGTPDAPACWDCHGAHNVLPSKDPSSTASAANIAKQCAKCHRGATDKFAKQAKELIHRRDAVKAANPIQRFFDSVKAWFS